MTHPEYPECLNLNRCVSDGFVISKKEQCRIIIEHSDGALEITEIKRLEFHECIFEEACDIYLDWLEPDYDKETNISYVILYCTRVKWPPKNKGQ